MDSTIEDYCSDCIGLKSLGHVRDIGVPCHLFIQVTEVIQVMPIIVMHLIPDLVRWPSAIVLGMCI